MRPFIATIGKKLGIDGITAAKQQKDPAAGYTIYRLIAGVTLDQADGRTRAALADKGFGVLT